MWERILGMLLEGLLAPDAPQVAAPAGPRRVAYRTRDGRARYGFSVEGRPGSYRVYITSQPPYGPRASGPRRTHRLTDAAGRRYVCWSDGIATADDALRVAAAWADATQLYIRTGRRF